MNDLDRDDLIDNLVIIVVSLVLGGLIGFYCGVLYLRNNAIKNNAGEYYLDKDFNKQFRWKTNLVQELK